MRHVVAIGGYATAGKDAFADALTDLGYTKTFMSAPLEKGMLILDPWIMVSTKDIADLLDEGYRVPIEVGYYRYNLLHELFGYEGTKIIREVRVFLQKLGTDFGRKQIAEDVWAKVMSDTVEAFFAQGIERVTVTGIRYVNEIAALRQYGCTAVWIKRPGVVAVNNHSSEHTLTEDDFDQTILNDGTLDDLALKAKILAVGAR